ncbi:uncharacterized protein EI97DRAFT_299265 [Westerdykella ornata]|uniref:Uncharacterized protein n=1 Tax=Westerdykella ornata TaxID=318751 RepID=A0A6A6JMZ8_WESOR|nr:uncharacterized protein EI97DRAFT_299265 [Westerdykella ornata]KAF2277614.1 hypothetical protein EI97DRAFT_299265 [Westerdykella ornata]
MALLAFKAIDYGADHIPDRFWEKLPGGFFTPADKKKAKHKNRDGRTRRELPHSSSEERRAHRDTNPPTDYSDFSAYDDTDHEREYRDRQRRRRAKSVGQSPSREINYGRGRDGGIQRSSDFDDVYDMDRSERAPQFPPPPASEYKPYNPADYAPPMGNEYGRRSSARPEYGPQRFTLQPPRHGTHPQATPPLRFLHPAQTTTSTNPASTSRLSQRHTAPSQHLTKRPATLTLPHHRSTGTGPALSLP